MILKHNNMRDLEAMIMVLLIPVIVIVSGYAYYLIGKVLT
jgi:hypothetical protein